MSEQDDGPLTPAEMVQEARKLGHAYLQEQHNVCGVWFLTLADALEAALAREERLREAAKTLESAVAEFLDADVAWTNDECDEAVVIAAINACKSAMYACRAARAALAPDAKEEDAE